MSSEANALAIKSNGDVYVAGDGGGDWVVRKLVAGSSLFQISDALPALSPAYGLAANSQGNLYATGCLGAAPSASTWITRKLVAP